MTHFTKTRAPSILGLGSLTLISLLAACNEPQPAPSSAARVDVQPEAAEAQPGAATTEASEAQGEAPLPAADVRIDGYLEIDDLDGTGPGNRDTNLCAQGPAGGENPTCDLDRPAADNPNFPGPDPTNPDALGTDEAAYSDWAHLDRSRGFFHYDLDARDPAQPDDIMKQGPCVATGPSPSKANIEMLGVAGNDDYLYLLMERAKTEGQEEFHFFFTQGEARFATIDACNDPTWVWDMEDGDVQVTVRFQSTSGLPSGDVIVQVYNDPDNDPSNDVGMDAEQIIRSPKWGEFAGTVPAYAAFNVAPGRKAEPDEDKELDLYGEMLDSGMQAEVAVDIATVFGQGCGLSRVMSVITTASGSGGDRDDLKDIYAPVVVRTGTPQLSMDLDQACTEQLTYKVGITGWGDGAPTLGDDNLQLDFSYECNGHSGNFNDDLGEGSIDIDIDHPVVCSVTATMTGSGPYANCVADTTEDFTLYPDLTATAEMAQAECGGPWTWAGAGVGGQTPYTYEWHFSGVGFRTDTDTTQPTGSGSLLPGTVPADIHGHVTVTDARGCDAPAGDDITAYHALSLLVSPTTSNQECFEGDVGFHVDVTGGTGNYTLAWTETDASLVGTCDGKTSLTSPDADADLDCAFDIGAGACPSGTVGLVVTDPVCGSQGPASVTGTVTQSVTVSAN